MSCSFKFSRYTTYDIRVKLRQTTAVGLFSIVYLNDELKKYIREPHSAEKAGICNNCLPHLSVKHLPHIKNVN